MLQGGPLEWLIFGLSKVDPKLKRIAELNEIMAFQPWTVRSGHMHSLLKGGSNQSENWTFHELVKGCYILFTYHALCGLCLGMGLVPDEDIQ